MSDKFQEATLDDLKGAASNWEVAARSWQARAEAAEAVNARLREALRPFAQYAELCDSDLPDTYPLTGWYGHTPPSVDDKSHLRLKHVRNARAALSDTAQRDTGWQHREDPIEGRDARAFAADMRERAAKLVEETVALGDQPMDLDAWWKLLFSLGESVRSLPLEPE